MSLEIKYGDRTGHGIKNCCADEVQEKFRILSALRPVIPSEYIRDLRNFQGEGQDQTVSLVLAKFSPKVTHDAQSALTKS
jgi:hypothetical protein